MAASTTEPTKPTNEAGQDAVLGRFSVASEAGGAVWSFQADGALVVAGPGDVLASGWWTGVDLGEREFDATLDVGVTGQTLSIMGEVSVDGSGIAMYVRATDPSAPDLGVPWPPESRVVGERVGMVADPSLAPFPSPGCQRPTWGHDGTIDWDTCEALPLPEPEAPVPSHLIDQP